MKSVLLILLIVATFFVYTSTEQSTERTDEETTPVSGATGEETTSVSGAPDEDATTASETNSTTTPWWTRTFPIIPTRAPKSTVTRVAKVTTSINRVSTGVSIAIPIVLFLITLSAGFGLIAYAIRTGGNGNPFLTRTV